MSENGELSQMTLGQLVTLLADNNTREASHAFFRALLLSKVGVRIPKAFGPVQPGLYRIKAGDNLPIPSGQAPNGEVVLLVYCDIPAMAAAHPAEPFAEIDSRLVLEWAKKSGYGVVVQNGLDGKASWAGVPAADVVDILNGKYGK
jgi:hypothetical protein